MKISSYLAALLAVAMVSGCSLIKRITDQPPVEAPPVVELPAPPVMLDYTVLHKADYNLDDRQTSRGFQVFDNADAYRSALAAYSVEVPRPVDFNLQRVVLATMGTQPRGGYAVNVVSVQDFEDQILITVEMRAPADNCIATSAQSNPYEFTLIASSKTIAFVETEVVTTCESE